ncbi:MAG: bifunctional 4-hydroxy-2-oxoglutarate aldolase/2-dehydro-3-deoxy-phosphogluconate aldolase [Elusimicrobia bacterium]|nr:bifunctional 4-hydroxy-2-oxoglutarate aldolase/2-dehydro-3-deoxy-phosphogluconate aldolase [Elusimicrobiota bacterium]
MVLTGFARLPFIGIIRGAGPRYIDGLVEAVCAGGLKTIEITMNTPGAAGVIERAAAAAGGRLEIGAGTVTDMKELHAALGAGASFIVMPASDRRIIEYCRRRSIPVFPGAMTPGEVLQAWRWGATMVKVFPVKFFGPGYIRELKGPFDKVKLLACGGINQENMEEYFMSGADGIAFGESVFRKDWIASGELGKITDKIRAMISAFERAVGPAGSVFDKKEKFV